MPVAKHPVEYVIGSGAFAKGYLLRDGDYLLQSPVTWYTAKDGYAIAPGYDETTHRGCNRVIEDNCLVCHAGIVSTPDHNPNKPMIHELAIGCERCHGAGAAHSELYQSLGPDARQSPPADSLIVNPASLNRRERESICAQCHLDGDVVAYALGKDAWDFRPGQDLSDLRSSYKATGDKATEKRFSNHFDQMWQSDCYLGSETLTCTTCHDPHRETAPQELRAVYREICNQCHSDDGCSKALAVRVETNQNDCTACHMPRSETEIPHTSTTNHRIAVHQTDAVDQATVPAEMALRWVTPSTDVLQSDQRDRRAMIARGYWAIQQTLGGKHQELLSLQTDPLRQSAVENADAESFALLARISRYRAEVLTGNAASRDQADAYHTLAMRDAQAALQIDDQPDTPHQSALETLADQQMVKEDYVGAIKSYEELTQIRRAAPDWYNLALCYAKQGRLADAESALLRSIELDAAYPQPYQSLARLYASVDPVAAARFQTIARRLTTRQ
ncbi:hypothetical protein NHH03_01175 [Stieleria sp. TO1_6]|uniref:cytochrome c3 family protein n=1 Tax=Stieleria tagensis TaxID=2956795 RepID=UPI00209B76BC|nr:cytochrome c3 family protein [Stieleria tagensis]MCO8120329.1 hypothetical protein [Stieleria tagensis]